MSKKEKCPHCGDVFTKRGMHLHIKAKHEGEPPSNGRPPGSSNKDFKRVEERPAFCPSCGSTELNVKPGSHKRECDVSGEIDGYKYNKVVWRLKVCECGQHVKVRSYEKTK